MTAASSISKGPVPVDVSGLHQHPVFRCRDMETSHGHLRSAISDHKLRSGSGEFDAALFAAGSGRLQFMLLRYGAEVEVTPSGVFEEFSLVQIPLCGESEIECDGARTVLVPGQAALVAPRRSLRVVWSSDCEQLLIRLPHSLLRAAAASISAQGQRPTRGFRSLVAPMTVLTGEHGRRWHVQVQSVMDAALGNASGEVAHPAWVQHCELSVALYLLTLQPVTGLEDAPGLRPVGSRSDPLALAEKFARARLCAPIALDDLARASGVSARTLHLHCTRRYGVGPMEWLRQLRLDVAREKLQRSDNMPVTEVAMSCGFGHLGRFAAYYKERFGELPKETVALG